MTQINCAATQFLCSGIFDPWPLIECIAKTQIRLYVILLVLQCSGLCYKSGFSVLLSKVIWAAAWQNQQSGCAPSEDSDQPGHPPSLIRVFAARMKKAWVLSYPLSSQSRLWSDWADAQADLSLRWAHSHFVGFDMRWLIYTSFMPRSCDLYFGLEVAGKIQPLLLSGWNLWWTSWAYRHLVNFVWKSKEKQWF